jgi:hypothetical protein
MSTNYYWTKRSNHCDKCGREDVKERMIGKSSMGWCFLLRVYPDEGINDLDDWIPLFEGDGIIIKDEYKKTISKEEMMRIITARAWHGTRNTKPMNYDSWEEFHERNQSVDGPNGLLRSRIGDFCIKHGVGTWDCIAADFS